MQDLEVQHQNAFALVVRYIDWKNKTHASKREDIRKGKLNLINICNVLLRGGRSNKDKSRKDKNFSNLQIYLHENK